MELKKLFSRPTFKTIYSVVKNKLRIVKLISLQLKATFRCNMKCFFWSTMLMN